MAPRLRDGMPLYDREQVKLAGRVGSVGIELVVATLIGYFGGRWVDGFFGTGKVFALIGLLFGIAAGFRGLYFLSKKKPHTTKKDSQANADAPSPSAGDQETESEEPPDA